MALDRREEVLRRWSRQKNMIHLKVLFAMVKLFCCFVFYSMVKSFANAHKLSNSFMTDKALLYLVSRKSNT